MRYVIHYDIAALVLAINILIHFYHKKGIRMPQTYVFICLIWLSLITDILDMITVAMDYYRWPSVPVYIVNLLYLIGFNVLPFLYYLYLFTVTKNRSEWTVKDKILMYTPVGWTVLFILTSPLTNLIFYYNEEEGYCHGVGFPLLYVATLIYMVASFCVAVYSRAKLTMWQKISVCVYVMASVLGIILQILFPDILLIQFAVSISLLFLYMSLESPDDDEEKRFAIYNRRGFDKLIANAVERQEAFHVIVISMTNFQAVREAAGVEFSQAMQKNMIDRLNSRIKPVPLCYLSEGRLAVIVGEKDSPTKVIKVIQEELKRPVALKGMNIQLETTLLQMDYPQEVESVEDIMDSIDYSSTEPFESSDGEVLHISGKILQGKRRESRILQIMQQALARGTFQVYYQPIFSVEKQKYNSAEALIRLYDEEMGFISPEEFIPMAEKNGMILKIGEFVFRTVCGMMARERIWEKGIDYIEVNLSVVQCMQEDICEMLYCIMDEYEIPYSCINFEITETTLSNDILWNIMERMTVGGTTFSLDDYGTGYSNLTNVLKYPFHIIKLDKSMVWYAMENEYAMRALRHTVSMIQDLDMHIVAEGVETEGQLDVLRHMGCEYLQGYYFSKPVPEAAFLLKLA
ncbi:MAG: EAL domain-containing protein [Acetatifactor sp.]